MALRAPSKAAPGIPSASRDAAPSAASRATDASDGPEKLSMVSVSDEEFETPDLAPVPGRDT
eukprot:2523319-Pyramimonas_sp.AAC.1